MCRQDIPPDYLEHPELVSHLDLTREESGYEDGGQWFYEGRNGWWLYDERTSQEIEGFWSQGDKRCELLIAGFLYIIDFENMMQFRRNDPSRRRRIKRDAASGPKKGVAGLRVEGSEETEIVESVNSSLSDENSDSQSNNNEEEETEDAHADTNSDENNSDLVSGISRLTLSEARVVTRIQLVPQSDRPNISLSSTQTSQEQVVPEEDNTTADSL